MKDFFTRLHVIVVRWVLFTLFGEVTFNTVCQQGYLVRQVSCHKRAWKGNLENIFCYK